MEVALRPVAEAVAQPGRRVAHAMAVAALVCSAVHRWEERHRDARVRVEDKVGREAVVQRHICRQWSGRNADVQLAPHLGRAHEDVLDARDDERLGAEA